MAMLAERRTVFAGSMLRCATEARACRCSPTLCRRARVTVPSRNPRAAPQAKDERMAASGGWRWALVHARGMARDIGLVLRIRSFQILILQVQARGVLPCGVAWRLHEGAVSGAVAKLAHFVHGHVGCHRPVPATAQPGIAISAPLSMHEEFCAATACAACVRGYQTCPVDCMLKAMPDCSSALKRWPGPRRAGHRGIYALDCFWLAHPVHAAPGELSALPTCLWWSMRLCPLLIIACVEHPLYVACSICSVHCKRLAAVII